MSRENRPLDIDVLSTFATAMLEMHRLDDLLWGIVTTIGRTLHWDDCVLYLREGQSLRQIAAYGSRNPPQGVLNVPVTIPLGQGISGSVGLSGKAEVVSDTSLDDRNAAYPSGGKSKLIVPIVYDDSVLAVIDCEAPDRDYFDAGDLRLISAIAAVSAPRVASAMRAQRQEGAAQQEATARAADRNDEIARQTSDLSQAVARLQSELLDQQGAEAELRVNRSLLAGMLGASPDGLLGVDDAGRVDYVSDTASKLLKLPSTGVLGLSLDEVCDIRDAVTNAVLPFSSIRQAGNECATEVFVRHGQSDGVVVTLLVSPRDVELGGFALTLRDHKRNSDMQHEAAKLQRLESLGLLAAGIGHDFNNLLAAILSSAESLVHDETLDSGLRDLASTIEKSALQGRELSQQLLTFARGGAPLKGDHDLSEVVQAAVGMAMTGQSAGVDLVIEDEMTAHFDRGQITQVIQNVVLNAAQASSSRDTVRVLVRQVEIGGKWFGEVVVRDTGRGIPKHQIKRVLDPFFTTKQKGTGMGLAVSYGILKRHDGTIDIFSEPGLGTEITLRLPVDRQKVAIELDDTRPDEMVSEPCRVLVVDDQSAVRLALSRMLELLGCEVLQAGDSKQALQQAQAAVQTGQPVNIAFLDLTMPGDHGGQSLTGTLREIDSDIKTVAFSGYAVDPVMSAYQSYGFDARLAKPFTRKELTTVLKSIRTSSAAIEADRSPTA